MLDQLVLPASQRVAATLLDLHLYAEQLGRILAGAGRETFLADAKLRYATMYSLVRIAEAVRQIPTHALSDYPRIDWTALGRFTAERSFEMTDADWEDVWQMASASVPTLLAIDVPPQPDDAAFPNRPFVDGTVPRIELPETELAAFSRRWRIIELAVFGSVLRDDFRPDSDVDVLVTFEPETNWSLFDQVAMEDQLAGLLGRRVDLVKRRSVESSPNWIRRRSILSTARPIYVDARSRS